MAKLFNRAKMTTATTGSGTVTLGSASNGFQTFAAAGVSNGDVVQYVIEEGANFEIGTGTYSSTGTSLTRSPTESSNSNNAITLAGQATVSITATHADFSRLQHDGSDKVTVSSTGASVTGNLAVSGTVDGRDVASDGSKLDGIESGATGDQTNAEIRAAVEAATDSNVFTDADHTKLNGIEANAKNDQTITAGGGLTGGGTGDVTISHSDTSSQASVNNSGRTYIQDITLDTYGHVTGLATATETVVNTDTNTTNFNVQANGGTQVNISAGEEINFINGNATTAAVTNQANPTVTFHHNDTSSQASVNNSGGTVIQDVTLDGYGHVTGLTSYNLDGRYFTESESDGRFVRKGVDYTWTATGSNALKFRSENTIDTASGTQASLEVHQDNAGHDAFMAFHVAGDYAAYFGLHGGINDFVVGGWSKGATYQRVFHDGYHPNADTLTTARTINGVSFNGSANITVGDSTKLPLSGGTMTGELQLNARLDVGSGTQNDAEVRIYKADNNVSDHIQFYNGTTRIGEIGCEDTTWLRINQETNKNIYTPRYIRADAGFFVDGTAKGINGSGNFIGGTIAGASDYGTLIRSNADDNVSGHTEWQDNYTIRLGSGADFRMWFDGTSTIFRNYAHSGGNIVFQGEDTEGTNHTLLNMQNDGSTPYVRLYQNGGERLRTLSGGVGVTGLTVGDVDANPHNAGGLQVSMSSDEKIVLSGSSNPYIRFQEGTTDKAYIRWQTDGYLAFNNQESGNFRFRSHATTQAVNIKLEASDGDLYGSVYGTHSNEIGFLDQDGNWAYRHARDSIHEWRINNGVEMSLTTATLDMKGNTITEVEDIGLRDRIYHDGDTNTYMQFHAADQWRVVVGGSERLEVKNSSPHVLVSGDLNSTSDERLKKNIKPIDNALADICQLEGVTFDWRDTGTQGQGFIAQQVEPIIPDVVNTDEDTGMKSINYVGLIGHLVEAIKTQQTQIDDLKAEIQSMKS